jgi:peptide/nickel transport system permease protein
MGAMVKFLFLRSIRTLLTLFGVVLLTFIFGRLSGDPVALMLPQTATIDDYERIRASMGLDQPLPVQFAIYFSDVLQGDLGNSVRFNRPALDIVRERIPATLELGIPALVLSIVLGIPLGVLSAYQRDRLIDRAIMSVSLAGQSLPSFLIGIFLILFLSVNLGLTPSFGRDTPQHLILPTLTLMIYPMAFIIRLTRSSVLEVQSEMYIRTAQAKGLLPRRVISVHLLRNALIPVVTIVGLQVAAIISGSAIVETVFAWPGIGLLAVDSIGSRDFPVIQTIVLLSAAAFGIVNMLVDVCYLFLDPRIRTAK